MILDLSKLSPGTLNDVLNAVDQTLRQEARRMADEIPFYGESEAKQQMIAWRDAIFEVTRAISEFKYNNNNNNNNNNKG